METNQLELSFLSIFSLIVFFIFLILSKYSNRLKNGILLDKDFFKPQAFHQTAVSRSGGLAGIISLNILLIVQLDRKTNGIIPVVSKIKITEIPSTPSL